MKTDEAAGNTLWKDGAEKEVAALIHHKYFAFKSPNFKPPKEYKYYSLHMTHDVKPDPTHKARLVCDGSRIDPRGLSTRSIVVKWISVHLLDFIADSQNLKVIQGDICNAFIHAHAKEDFFTKSGSSFGDRAGPSVII